MTQTLHNRAAQKLGLEKKIYCNSYMGDYLCSSKCETCGMSKVEYPDFKADQMLIELINNDIKISKDTHIHSMVYKTIIAQDLNKKVINKLKKCVY